MLLKSLSLSSIGRTSEKHLPTENVEEPSTGMNDEDFIKFMGGDNMPCTV